MPNLAALADHIASLIRNRASLQIELSHCDEDERARKAHIVAGIELSELGKTDAARKIGLESVYAGDDVLRKIAARQSELRDTITECQAEIEALETVFKAERWEIRRALAQALGGRARPEGGPEADFDAAMDDITDDSVVAAAEAELETDEIPF